MSADSVLPSQPGPPPGPSPVCADQACQQSKNVNPAAIGLAVGIAAVFILGKCPLGSSILFAALRCPLLHLATLKRAATWQVFCCLGYFTSTTLNDDRDGAWQR